MEFRSVLFRPNSSARVGRKRVVMGTTPSESLASCRFLSTSKVLHPTATLLIWRGDMAKPLPDWRDASKALADETARHRKSEASEEAHGVRDQRQEHRRGDRRALVEQHGKAT